MYDWIGKLTRYMEAGLPGAGLVRLLPRWLAGALLWTTGTLLYTCLRKQRAAVARNMEEVLCPQEPQGTGKERAVSGTRLSSLVKGYFIHGAATLLELLVDSDTLPEGGNGRFRLEGEHHLNQVLQPDKGAILYAPHLGNFFYAYWFLSQRYACLTVATASSPELHPLYLKFQRMGCHGLDYDQTPPLELMGALKNHLLKGGVVLLLGDFYRPQFPKTRLFGRTTRGPAGAAMLALMEQLPVIPCYSFRQSYGRHSVVLEEPVWLHERYARNERAEAMLELNTRLEQMIMRKPEQWFYWFQTRERWITKEENDGYSKSSAVRSDFDGAFVYSSGGSGSA